MPEQLTMEEIVERLQSLDDLETALDAVRKGDVRPHEHVVAEARQRLNDKKWPQP